MKMYKRLFFSALLTLISFAISAAPSESFQRKREALYLLKQFTDEMCEQVPIKGSQQNWELSGDVNAKFKGVAKALIDAGASIGAKYSGGDYSGFLQQDLLFAQKNRNECKKHYFDSLKGEFFGSGGASSKTSQTNSADVLLTFDDFNFDDQSKTLYLRAVFNNTLSDSVTVTAVRLLARHDEKDGGRIIGTPRWTSLSLPPRTATPYTFTVSISDIDANYLAQPRNLPQRIFVDLRAINSKGFPSSTEKHFMTLGLR